MRHVTNWLLFLLALAAVAAGVAEQAGRLHRRFPRSPSGDGSRLRRAPLHPQLPLKVRRAVVFFVTLAGLGGLTAGLAYFQFFVKPTMVKGFMRPPSRRSPRRCRQRRPA